jgi:type VI protein secretion system component VasK
VPGHIDPSRSFASNWRLRRRVPVHRQRPPNRAVINTEQATHPPRRVGAWLDQPRRWLGRHPRLYTAVAVLALLAVVANVYNAGRDAGAAAWQRATDRVMEQQALDAATRPLPPLPPAVDKDAALQAFRSGASYVFALGDDGIHCWHFAMLPDGTMWELTT